MIGDLFSAHGAAIYFNCGDDGAEFIFSDGLANAVQVYQSEEWWRHDIHAQRAIAMHLTGGDVFDDNSVATKQEIETLPIFTGFFQKVGFGWLMGCIIVPDFNIFASVSVPRAKGRGAFSENEREMLRLISRHVEQALRLSMKIANLEREQEIFQWVMDKIEAGLYMLDAEGRLLLKNRAGQDQFASYFKSIDGRLTALDQTAAPAFNALLSNAQNVHHNQLAPRSCMLRNKDGQRIVVSALPLTDSGRSLLDLNETARTLVLTTPADNGAIIDPTVLRDVFDLSLGEARLASLVGGGVTVRNAANKLGVTEGTARIVLKRIFQKLGINRQAELVLQISALGQHQLFRPKDGEQASSRKPIVKSSPPAFEN